MTDIPAIVVTGDCDCPICGAPEVTDKTLPVKEWRFNVRAFRVTDADGTSWSECIPCKERDGNGWFAHDDSGNVLVEPSRIAALEARGESVDVINK